MRTQDLADLESEQLKCAPNRSDNKSNGHGKRSGDSPCEYGQHGDDWKPFCFYEDCFLQVFPAVLNDVEPTPYSTAEEDLRSCYSIRALERFLQFMGLANIEKIPSDKPFSREYRIKKRALLGDAVRFRLTAVR